MPVVTYSDQDVPVTKTEQKIRDILADAFTFVRSMEANAALSAITLEQLMGDQIERNGESSASKASKYNPYVYDPNSPSAKPASSQAQDRVTFWSGTTRGMPTKLDRVLAITNAMNDAIQEVKKMAPITVSGNQELFDQGNLTTDPTEEE